MVSCRPHKTKLEHAENDSISNLRLRSRRTNVRPHFISMLSWSTLQGLRPQECNRWTGAPGAKRGPGANSNMTDFRFCGVQNRRRKCYSLVRKMMWSQKKKVFTEILTVFPFEIRWSPPKKKVSSSWLKPTPHGPHEVHGPRDHCTPLPLLSAALQVKPWCGLVIGVTRWWWWKHFYWLQISIENEKIRKVISKTTM